MHIGITITSHHTGVNSLGTRAFIYVVPTRIRVLEGIIPHITVPVQALRVAGTGHERIRADEPLRLRSGQAVPTWDRNTARDNRRGPGPTRNRSGHSITVPREDVVSLSSQGHISTGDSRHTSLSASLKVW